MKDFFENIRHKFNLCFFSSKEKEIRFFAGMELFCLAASFIAALWLIIALICSKAGFAQSGKAQAWMSVFLSAAVGYLTNYLAIEMLFKPYKPDKKHFFSIMTFTYWKQGLIPKNKHKIGIQLGEIVGERLLNPEKISDELCNMVSSFLKGEKVISKFKDYIREGLKKHKARMSEYLAPRIEAELINIVRREITADRIRSFVIENVMPFITQESTRETVAKYIKDGLQKRIPGLTEILKKELNKKAEEYLREKLSRFLPVGADSAAIMLSEGLVWFIDWDYVQSAIKEKISGKEFYDMAKEEIFRLGNNISDWISSPESETAIYGFIAKMHSKIASYLDENLAGMLSRLADGLISSEDLWKWAENEMLPAAREKVEETIRQEGKDLVMSKLALSDRISAEIDKQDIKEFHGMINELAAQHLGAIQVIGWILGFVIGLMQLLL